MDAVLGGITVKMRGLDREAIKRSFLEWLVYSVGKDPDHATRRDWFASLALSVRDRIIPHWMQTTQDYYRQDAKRVYYLSLEFLIGRLLTNSMSNLGIVEVCREALAEVGVDLDQIIEAEPDQALGNGGLGRLAACFLDSMATLGIPGYGYGIRYEFGLFEQSFNQGWQVEYPEDWLKFGNPWEFERPEVAYPIDFHGQVEATTGADGREHFRWHHTQRMTAVAYDTPVVGFGGERVNTLRLWSAKPMREFDLSHFNRGDYLRAVEDKVISENLSRVLYPNDQTPVGQELRLKQEYFFTSASLQDILRRHRQHHEDFSNLADRAAIQLNDTHPAIAVPELMRLLMDRYGLEWGTAWDLTRGTIAYTNHTLLPEALETWPIRLLERVLPRHVQIIYEINAQFLKSARTLSGPDVADDPGRAARISLIEENGDRRVRMGNLAFVGSHKVNGVSALHTELMKETVFADLHREFPDRITNKTNGITPRRWLVQANPQLTRLIKEAIGENWITDLEKLEALKAHAKDAGFRENFALAKKRNKHRLAVQVDDLVGVRVSTDALFDVQVKRIHEYKRQLLNILDAIASFAAIKEDPSVERVPRVKIFAGKAAPGYAMAKLVIKLANDVARVVNTDPDVADRLKLCFLPNYNVTLAERIIPAADLSEQISTAGMEASGTGNMKFALNGAITIGTLDGANVEIAERVGLDNILIFGLTADEVAAKRATGYDPRAVVEAEPELKRALDMIAGGAFSSDDPGRFRPIVDAILNGDWFMVAADFAAYRRAQAEADRLYADRDLWFEKAILNTASVGWFSSDRTVREYAEEIWNTPPALRAAAE